MTFVYLDGDQQFTVKESVDQVIELLTAPGPHQLIELTPSDTSVFEQVVVDAHSVVAIAELRPR